jgi:hydrogenase nickel incorporation protein HypB
MCDVCGCGDTELVTVELQHRILSRNDSRALHNREHFEQAGVFAVNLMGSPGSGKTALLEATAAAFGTRRRLSAVSGDLATDHDAVRLSQRGIASRSITTGSACHLDAEMVHEALHHLDWQAADYLFVENVGNLVCPAVYELGEHWSVVALSVTEGEDKPLKYPVMFRKADLVVLTKVDLLPALPEISVSRIAEALARVMPSPKWIALSARSGQGMEEWIEALEGGRGSLLARSIRCPLKWGTP